MREASGRCINVRKTSGFWPVEYSFRPFCHYKKIHEIIVEFELNHVERLLRLTSREFLFFAPVFAQAVVENTLHCRTNPFVRIIKVKHLMLGALSHLLHVGHYGEGVRCFLASQVPFHNRSFVSAVATAQVVTFDPSHT